MYFLKLLTFLILLNKTFGLCDFTFNKKNKILNVIYMNYGDPIEDCISPLVTTGLENKNSGSVVKIILKNLFVPILHRNFVLNFTNVHTVELTGNKIRTIESESFKNLFNMQVLDLSDNKINDLQSNFVSNSSQLRKLILTKNKLTNFQQELFTSLPKLENLNLTYNQLQELNSFGSTRLEVLDLSHNFIVKVDEASLENLPALKHLDLSYNKIIQFSDQTFVSVVGLKKLNLFHNNISYLSPDVLNSLYRLHELIISFNPFPCECYNEITKWASEEGVLLNGKSFICNEIEDNTDVPVCVTTDGECTAEYIKEDLFSILHSNGMEFNCRMIDY